MNATRDWGADRGGGGSGSGRKARGLWLGAAATAKDDAGRSPGMSPCNTRRKITFARLATCVLNVERARRKTVSLYTSIPKGRVQCGVVTIQTVMCLPQGFQAQPVNIESYRKECYFLSRCSRLVVEAVIDLGHLKHCYVM